MGQNTREPKITELCKISGAVIRVGRDNDQDQMYIIEIQESHDTQMFL